MDECDALSSTEDIAFDTADNGEDVILRSCNSIDFYTHKSYLSLASPFFDDMFSLHQPLTLDTQETLCNSMDVETEQHLPVIDVTENSFTIYHLLRLCHPEMDSALTSLVGVGDIMEAATKYDMESVLAFLQQFLRDKTKGDPVRAYAIATRFRLQEIAFDAAEEWRIKTNAMDNNSDVVYTSDSPLGEYDTPWEDTFAASSYDADMGLLPAGAYFRLLRHVRSNLKASLCTLSFEEPAQKSSVGTPPGSLHLETKSGDETNKNSISLGFLTLQAVDPQHADVVLRSQDGVNLYANRTIISFASPKLAAHISAQLQSLEGGDLLVANLSEQSHTLSLILQSIQPSFSFKAEFSTPSASLLPSSSKNSSADLEAELERLLAFINASLEYSIQGSLAYSKHLLTQPKFLDNFPLQIFFIAARSGWKDEARPAAIHCARQRFIMNKYVKEMEGVSAPYLYALLKFQREYQRPVCGCVKDDPERAWSSWRMAGPLFDHEEVPPLEGMFSPEVLFVYMMDDLVRGEGAFRSAGDMRAKLSRLHVLAYEVTDRLRQVSFQDVVFDRMLIRFLGRVRVARRVEEH